MGSTSDEGHEGEKGGRSTSHEGYEGKERGHSAGDESHEGEEGGCRTSHEGHEGQEGGCCTSHEGYEGLSCRQLCQWRLHCMCLPSHVAFGHRPTVLTGSRGARPSTFGK